MPPELQVRSCIGGLHCHAPVGRRQALPVIDNHNDALHDAKWLNVYIYIYIYNIYNIYIYIYIKYILTVIISFEPGHIYIY